MDDRDQGKEKLLKAALDCLIAKGLKKTTVEDVANAANVTRRTVYRYYPGKQAIIDAVCDYGRARLFQRLGEELEPHADDFPRYVEECIVYAATYSPDAQNYEAVTSTDNFTTSGSFVTGPEARAHWREILEPPYRRYAAHNTDVGELDDLIAAVGRLVHAYRNTPESKARMRAQLRTLGVLGQPE